MRIPRWAALAIWPVALLFFHFSLPLILSLFSGHYGWTGGSPGLWNAVGLALVAPGLILILWALKLHFTSASEGWKLELAPGYLLARGPYRYTRNPMYVGAFLIWLGWTIFYGSAAVLVAFLVLSAIILFVLVPLEERALERRFGEEYRRYKGEVPRWIPLTRKVTRRL